MAIQTGKTLKKLLVDIGDDIDSSLNSSKSYTDSAIAESLASVYTVKGTASVSTLNDLTRLNSSSLQNYNGFVYDLSDSGALNNKTGTTAVNIGDNVVFIYDKSSSSWKWDKLSANVDLSGYVQKTTTIADIDLTDDIDKETLLSALNVEDGAQANTVNTVNGQQGSIQTYKGLYSDQASYYVGDIIFYESKLYVCIQESTAGTLPTNQSYFLPTGDNLPQTYFDYLDNATYVKPTIAEFTLTPSITTCEIGTTVNISAFTHYETTIDNIATVSLISRTGSSTQVTKSASSTTVNYTDSYHFTTNRTIDYVLKIVDTKNNVITNAAHITSYTPSYIGEYNQSSISDSGLSSLSKISSTDLVGIRQVTISGNTGYIYFVTSSTISTIRDYNTGFGVDYSKISDLTVSVNGVDVVYKVYRTVEMLQGEYTYLIS